MRLNYRRFLIFICLLVVVSTIWMDHGYALSSDGKTNPVTISEKSQTWFNPRCYQVCLDGDCFNHAVFVPCQCQIGQTVWKESGGCTPVFSTEDGIPKTMHSSPQRCRESGGEWKKSLAPDPQAPARGSISVFICQPPPQADDNGNINRR